MKIYVKICDYFFDLDNETVDIVLEFIYNPEKYSRIEYLKAKQFGKKILETNGIEDVPDDETTWPEVELQVRLAIPEVGYAFINEYSYNVDQAKQIIQSFVGKYVMWEFISEGVKRPPSIGSPASQGE